MLATLSRLKAPVLRSCSFVIGRKMIDTGDWQGYLANLAQIAGTMFALVVAARGLVIGIGRSPNKTVGARERSYVLLDSVSSTYELAAAALLALLAGMPKAHLFLAVLPMLVAALGIGLVVVMWSAVWIAHKEIKANKKVWREAWIQALLSLLPFACYGVCFVVWLSEAFGIWKWSTGWGEDLMALAITWLTISGILQAIWWYMKTWVDKLSPK